MKPMDVYKFFNRRVIIIELEACFNDDYAIDAPGITQGQIETAAVVEVLQREYTPVGELGEEAKYTVVPEK